MLGLSKTQGWVALGGAAAALAVFGLWLGRSATESVAEPMRRAAAAPEPPAVTAPAPSPKMNRDSRFHAAAPPKPASAPGLAADLVDPDPRVRRAALAELVKSGGADPQLLVTASHDGDLGVAFTATEALGVAYANGQLPATELVARIKDHGANEKLRVAALDGIGVVPTADNAALLVDLLAHGDVTERRSAAILLQHQDLDIAIPALAGALGDADEWVRENALQSLKARARGRDFGMDANAWRAWWQARPR